MRHWLVKPELMCMQHRAGEHLETHMFLGAMQRNKNLKGFYENGLFFGPAFLYYRHEELSKYLTGHRSPILSLVPGSRLSQIPGLVVNFELYPDTPITSEALKTSLRTLISRCSTCLSLHMKAKDEGKSISYRVDTRTLLQFGRLSVSTSREGNP